MKRLWMTDMERDIHKRATLFKVNGVEEIEWNVASLSAIIDATIQPPVYNMYAEWWNVYLNSKERLV